MRATCVARRSAPTRATRAELLLAWPPDSPRGERGAHAPHTLPIAGECTQPMRAASHSCSHYTTRCGCALCAEPEYDGFRLVAARASSARPGCSSEQALRLQLRKFPSVPLQWCTDRPS
jgi:hypothetical protein